MWQQPSSDWSWPRSFSCISRPAGDWLRLQFFSSARQLASSSLGRCTDRGPDSEDSCLIMICDSNFFGPRFLPSLPFHSQCLSLWRWPLFWLGGARAISAIGRHCWRQLSYCCCDRHGGTVRFGRCRLFLSSSAEYLPICW